MLTAKVISEKNLNSTSYMAQEMLLSALEVIKQPKGVICINSPDNNGFLVEPGSDLSEEPLWDRQTVYVMNESGQTVAKYVV